MKVSDHINLVGCISVCEAAERMLVVSEAYHSSSRQGAVSPCIKVALLLFRYTIMRSGFPCMSPDIHVINLSFGHYLMCIYLGLYAKVPGT